MAKLYNGNRHDTASSRGPNGTSDHPGVRIAVVAATPVKYTDSTGNLINDYNLTLVKCNDTIDADKNIRQLELEPYLTNNRAGREQEFNSETGEAMFNKDGSIRMNEYHDTRYKANQIAFINQYLPDGRKIEQFAEAYAAWLATPADARQPYDDFITDNAPVFNAPILTATETEKVPSKFADYVTHDVMDKKTGTKVIYTEVKDVPYRESIDDDRPIEELPTGDIHYEGIGKPRGIILRIPAALYEEGAQLSPGAARIKSYFSAAPSNESHFDYKEHKTKTAYANVMLNVDGAGNAYESYPEGHPLHFTYDEFKDNLYSKMVGESYSDFRQKQFEARRDYVKANGTRKGMPYLYIEDALPGFIVASERGLDPEVKEQVTFSKDTKEASASAAEPAEVDPEAAKEAEDLMAKLKDIRDSNQDENEDESEAAHAKEYDEFEV